jgi:hypothetical protein
LDAKFSRFSQWLLDTGEKTADEEACPFIFADARDFFKKFWKKLFTLKLLYLPYCQRQTGESAGLIKKLSRCLILAFRLSYDRLSAPPCV